MSDDSRPIIIKKQNIVAGEGHHGGAWKVAYADFVTAMMAFFLLMWLLNATSEDQRKGLADFFDPSLPISRTSAGGAGMLGGDTVFIPPEASGSHVDGIRARPTRELEGEDLGEETAFRDGPEAESTDPVEDPAAGPLDALPTPGGIATEGTELDAEADTERLERLERDLLAEVKASGEAGLLDHFEMRITPEGLVIEIVDVVETALFRSGEARPQPILGDLIEVLIPVLEQTTNDIAIDGHTDATPFIGRADYSNWELSADRASAARRLMIDRGFTPERITRISGRAATDPVVADMFAPKNRRIAITLLREPS